MFPFFHRLTNFLLNATYHINSDDKSEKIFSLYEGKFLIGHIRNKKTLSIEELMLGTISWKYTEEEKVSKSGLSSGQKAAITCAVLLFAGVCTVAAIFVYRNRDREMTKPNVQVTEFGSKHAGLRKNDSKLNGVSEGKKNLKIIKDKKNTNRI